MKSTVSPTKGTSRRTLFLTRYYWLPGVNYM